MRTRAEHLAWCKTRAHEYLDSGDVPNAIASMLSDLGKHKETTDAGKSMAMLGLLLAAEGNFDGARRFIDGFN